MLENLTALLRLIAEVIGISARPWLVFLETLGRSLAELTAAALPADAGTLVLVTALVAALALLAVALSLYAGRVPAGIAVARPRRAIRDATRLTQSHPDAPGHPRPRAPGSAAPAA